MKTYPGIRSRGNTITISIPLNGSGSYAYEIQKMEPTQQNLQACANLRHDFITAWDLWKVKPLGPFDYRSFFPQSKNKYKYLHFGGDQLTIADRLDNYYLELKNEAVLSPSTIFSYHGEISKLKDCFGEMYISELTRLDIQNMVDEARVTPKTIRNRVNHLKQIINEAMTEGVILINLFGDWKVKHKAVNASKYKKDCYTPDEVNNILVVAKKSFPHFYSVILFRATMGMRPGEVFGLKWKYVNELLSQVEVKETRPKGIQKNTPKSKAGERILKLNAFSLEAIKIQRELTYNPERLVFQNEGAIKKEKAWTDKTFSRIWHKVLDITGVRHLDPYVLRHSFATMMLESGKVSIEHLSAILGHTDTKVTMDAYVVKKRPTHGLNTSNVETLFAKK